MSISAKYYLRLTKNGWNIISNVFWAYFPKVYFWVFTNINAVVEEILLTFQYSRPSCCDEMFWILMFYLCWFFVLIKLN